MEDNARDGFVFYRSFFESIDLLDVISQQRLYRAIAAYGLMQIEPEFDEAIEEALWCAFKPQLDANHKRYLNAKKGGAPIGNANARKSKSKRQKNNLKQPKDKDKDKEKEKVKVKKRVCVSNAPTQEEILNFISKNNLIVDGILFYNHYTAKGWEGVLDWQAMILKWDAEDKKRKNNDNQFKNSRGIPAQVRGERSPFGPL